MTQSSEKFPTQIEVKIRGVRFLKLVRVMCGRCKKSFYVERRRGKNFESMTSGVTCCPFCGDGRVFIDSELVLEVV